MTREPNNLAMKGAAIVAAQLRGDHADRDVLITTFVRQHGFPSLVEAFSYAAIAAVDIAADAQGMSFHAALDVVDARQTKAVRFAAATKNNERDAVAIRSTMDVHSAVKATFQLAFSAFLTLARVTGVCCRSAEEWASAVSTGRVETLSPTA